VRRKAKLEDERAARTVCHSHSSNVSQEHNECGTRWRICSTSRLPSPVQCNLSLTSNVKANHLRADWEAHRFPLEKRERLSFLPPRKQSVQIGHEGCRSAFALDLRSAIVDLCKFVCGSALFARDCDTRLTLPTCTPRKVTRCMSAPLKSRRLLICALR
jgi:hypothetical protein